MGERVRALRERADLSRDELCYRLRANQGVKFTPGALYNLERGDSQSMDLKNAAAIARELSEVLGEQIDIYDLFPELAPPWRRIRDSAAR